MTLKWTPEYETVQHLEGLPKGYRIWMTRFQDGSGFAELWRDGVSENLWNFLGAFVQAKYAAEEKAQQLIDEWSGGK